MDAKQVKRRTAVLMVFFCCILGGFVYVLYQSQIVNGDSYRTKATTTIAQTETVDASRGEILDCYGRSLVSNVTSYNVTLDASALKKADDQVAVLRQLLKISAEEGVVWTDTLPLSAAAPYSYTFDETTSSGRAVKTRLQKLLAKLEIDAGTVSSKETTKTETVDGVETQVPATEEVWTPTLTADELMAALRKEFKIPADVGDAEARQLVGVLYEVALRSAEVSKVEYVFASDVSISFITKVKEAELTGVSINAAATRQYNTTYAAHLLGYTSKITDTDWPTYKELGYSMDATVGKSGVESAFEEYLHGTSGVRAIETSTSGKIISESWLTEPQPGDNVVLTIDIRLQAAVENLMAQHISAMDESSGGACVILDVNSGAVLAMASYPTYDPSTFSQKYSELAASASDPLLNRATQGLFAPGSTFKMVTATAGLQEGIITPSTRILDTGKYTYFKDYQPACWLWRRSHSTHGWETVSDAIRDSCNVFFYDVGRRVGIDKLGEYASKFGLGRATGIELPEKTGYVAGPDTSAKLGSTWTAGSVLPAAIGQENNQFTPVQIANYVATLVNGGTHYAVHLLKSVKSSDYSQVISNYEPQVMDTIDIDQNNLAAIKLGMYEVTQSSTIYPYFKNLPVKCGAKTGTAQITATAGTNALFVCFAPYDDPQIAMCLVVQKGASGSSLAALAADIISYYFLSGEDTVSSVSGENTLVR